MTVRASRPTCGVLAGPDGRRLAFVPGAEGLALAGTSKAPELWVASESTARFYWAKGGRPAVPSLVALDTRRVADWPDAACMP